MDVAVDIDEQLTTLMALATQPPAIVRPYFDADETFQHLYKQLSSDNAMYRKAFEAWISQVKNSRHLIIKLLDDNDLIITSKFIDILSQFALFFEKKADLNALELTKHQKQTNNILAQLSAADGKHESAKLKPLIKSRYSWWHEEIDVYLDMALLLRGLAGKYDPDQEVVFTAKSSEDIDKFFESLN